MFAEIQRRPPIGATSASHRNGSVPFAGYVQKVLDICLWVPRLFTQRRARMEASFEQMVGMPEYAEWQEGREIRAIASEAGLNALLYQMPNQQNGWMIDGVQSSQIGNATLLSALRRLADTAREHGTTVFVVVDKFSVDDADATLRIEPVGKRSKEHQRLYDWLVNELGWHSLGETQNGFGEMVGTAPVAVA